MFSEKINTSLSNSIAHLLYLESKIQNCIKYHACSKKLNNLKKKLL